MPVWMMEQSLSKVMDSSGNMGIDVLDGQVKDLVKAGIIDPVKVTRSALQNAASVAVMVMTTNCLITDAPEKTPPPPLICLPAACRNIKLEKRINYFQAFKFFKVQTLSVAVVAILLLISHLGGGSEATRRVQE